MRKFLCVGGEVSGVDNGYEDCCLWCLVVQLGCRMLESYRFLEKNQIWSLFIYKYILNNNKFIFKISFLIYITI